VFIFLIPAVFGAVLGFIIILLLRISILMLLRCAFFSAFYRKKPAASNVMFIVLETWNIALTFGFVTVRAVKLIAISVMFIARCDVPFLAPGVGKIGPVELDGSFTAFRKNLLMHEAHRHPLIERFGLLCLLKLRAGDHFGTRAGAAWRLLYVLTMMPWLRKYRIKGKLIERKLSEGGKEASDELDKVSKLESRNKRDELRNSSLFFDCEEFDEASMVQELMIKNCLLEARILELEGQLKGSATEPVK
jgi:hypothetical protein